MARDTARSSGSKLRSYQWISSRAGPGGQGHMLNLIYPEAMRHFLSWFDGALAGYAGALPRAKLYYNWELAEKDPAMAGVILRINSPGGTVTASDIIHHDISEFRKRTRLPVHACIMSTGTSGGRVFDIAPQPLEFQWIATAENYLSSVVAYRYGWDVMDPNSENDPGWALPPGLTRAWRDATRERS